MSYIKIYFDDKPLFLTDKITEELAAYKSQPDTVYKEGISTYYFHVLPHEIRKPNYSRAIIFHPNLVELKESFFAPLKTITAGGGVVQNDKGEILLILRLGKWDLPKGKQDEGENLEECALREVSEETGLTQITSDGAIYNTFHSYSQNGTLVIKETAWFAMKALGIENLAPQNDEGITEIRWVKKEDLNEYLKNTYQTIIEVLHHFFISKENFDILKKNNP